VGLNKEGARVLPNKAPVQAFNQYHRLMRLRVGVHTQTKHRLDFNLKFRRRSKREFGQLEIFGAYCIVARCGP